MPIAHGVLSVKNYNCEMHTFVNIRPICAYILVVLNS